MSEGKGPLRECCPTYRNEHHTSTCRLFISAVGDHCPSVWVFNNSGVRVPCDGFHEGQYHQGRIPGSDGPMGQYRWTFGLEGNEAGHVEIDKTVVDAFESPEDSLEAQIAKIADWWGEHAKATIARTAPKAVEYGSDDLDIMGAGLLKILPVPDEITGEERAEIGRYAACAFYALGKISRVISALKQGRLPGPDSEFDIEVYAVMMQRIRETGRWT